MPQALPFTPLRTEIAGVPVVELAQQFGTPTFVYDGAKIVERMHDLRAFDVIRYAQKACSNLAILDLVRRHGGFVDALAPAKFIGHWLPAIKPTASDSHSPPPIVYTADIFDAKSLDWLSKHGIHVNCGSPDMIDQFGERAPGRHITLRINPGFGHGHSQKTNTGGEQSKHGIWHTDLADCLRRADANGLGVTGLHMHIGSGTDLEHLRHVCQAMEKTARDVGRSIIGISAGGGLPVPYRAEESYVDLNAYFQLWDATRKRLEDAFGHKVWLEIEPGRYLVAESGYLISEIRAIKRMGANTFYLARCRLQQFGAADFVRRLSSDVDRAQIGQRPRTTAASGRRRRPAVRIGRYFHAGRRRHRLHPQVARRRSRRIPGPRSGRCLRLRDGQQLQQQTAGRRSADSRRPSSFDSQRQTLDDVIRGEIIPSG